MVVLVIILLLLLGSFGVLYWALDRHQRLVNAREGEQNPRGRKLMLEGELPDIPEGCVRQDRLFLHGGQGQANSCIGWLCIPYLCEGERLLLTRDRAKPDLLIKNHRRVTVGRITPEHPHHATIAIRHAAGEVINLWVSEWGASKGFYCEVTVELYGNAEQAAPSPEPPQGVAVQSSVVFFPTHDLAATAAFYATGFGFAVKHQTSTSIIVDTGYGYLGFADYGDEQPLATGCCISLNCASRSAVDRAYGILRRDHIVLHAPQRHPVFPVYSFFMNDPNGYTLELQFIE